MTALTPDLCDLCLIFYANTLGSAVLISGRSWEQMRHTPTDMAKPAQIQARIWQFCWDAFVGWIGF